MKKLFSLVLVVSAMLFATEAGAQIKFGVKGGLNVTDMSFNSKVLSASNRTGFYIGPTVKFTLPGVTEKGAKAVKRNRRSGGTATVKNRRARSSSSSGSSSARVTVRRERH